MSPENWKVVKRAADDGLEGYDLLFESIRQVQTELAPYLSVEGIFIPTDAPLPHSSVLRFRVLLPDDFALIEGTGVVFWLRTPEEAGKLKAGMAVNFVSLGDRSRDLIEKIVETHLKSGGRPFDVHAKTLSEDPPPSEKMAAPPKKLTLGMREKTPAPKNLGVKLSVRGKEEKAPVTPPPEPADDPNATVLTNRQPPAAPVSQPEPESLASTPPMSEPKPEHKPDQGALPFSEPEVSPEDDPAAINTGRDPGPGEFELDDPEPPGFAEQTPPPAEQVQTSAPPDSRPTFDLDDVPTDEIDVDAVNRGEEAELSLDNDSTASDPDFADAPTLGQSGDFSEELALERERDFGAGIGDDEALGDSGQEMFGGSPAFDEPEPPEPAAFDPSGGPSTPMDDGPSWSMDDQETGPLPDISDMSDGGVVGGESHLESEEPGFWVEEGESDFVAEQTHSPEDADYGMPNTPQSDIDGGTPAAPRSPDDGRFPTPPAFDAPTWGDDDSGSVAEYAVPEPVRDPYADQRESEPAPDSVSESAVPDALEIPEGPRAAGSDQLLTFDLPDTAGSEEEPEAQPDVPAQSGKRKKRKKKRSGASAKRSSSKKSKLGTILVAVLVLAVLGGGGYFGWNWYQDRLVTGEGTESADAGSADGVLAGSDGEEGAGSEVAGMNDGGEAASVDDSSEGVVPTPVPSPTPVPVQVAAGPAAEIVDIGWTEEGGQTIVLIRADAAIEERQLDVFPMQDPPRILVRLRKIESGYPDEVINAGTSALSRIRTGFHPEQSPPALYIVLDTIDANVAVSGQEIEGQVLRIVLGR